MAIVLNMSFLIIGCLAVFMCFRGVITTTQTVWVSSVCVLTMVLVSLGQRKATCPSKGPSRPIDLRSLDASADENASLDQARAGIDKALRVMRMKWSVLLVEILIVAVISAFWPEIYGRWVHPLNFPFWCSIGLTAGFCVLTVVALCKQFSACSNAKGDLGRAKSLYMVVQREVLVIIKKRRDNVARLAESKVKDIEESLGGLRSEQIREDMEWGRRQSELNVLQEKEQHDFDSQLAAHNRNIHIETEARDAFDKLMRRHQSAEMKRHEEEDAVRDEQRTTQQRLLSGLCAVDKMIDDIEESFKTIVDSVNTLTQEDVHE